MAFMQPQYVEGWWLNVDGPNGVTSLPGDLFGVADGPQNRTPALPEASATLQYLTEPEDDASELELEWDWGVGMRLSAPGYSDCTPWVVLSSLKRARMECVSLYDVCPLTGREIPHDPSEAETVGDLLGHYMVWDHLSHEDHENAREQLVGCPLDSECGRAIRDLLSATSTLVEMLADVNDTPVWQTAYEQANVILFA